MKIGFIFAGQGQQFLDMGQDLVENCSFAKEIYSEAEAILGYSLLSLSKDQLENTEYTQPALYTLGAVLDKLLKNKNIEPSYVAGLSLGEYNALLSADVFTFSEGLKLIEKRAKIMANAFKENETGMIACLKTSYAAIEEILSESSLEICNYNSPSQIVLGGMSDEVTRMLPILKANKIIAIPLKVSTVSHMSLLNAASLELAKVLATVDFKTPKIDFINNLQAQIQNDNFVDTLAKHIASATQLYKSVEAMYDLGVRHFIEVGPKGSIRKLIKEIIKDDDVIISNVYDLKTLEGVSHE